MSASKDFEIGLRVVGEGYDEKSISEVIKQIEKKYSDIDLLKFNKKNLSKEKKIYGVFITVYVALSGYIPERKELPLTHLQ